jgi:hypothetical protein
MDHGEIIMSNEDILDEEEKESEIEDPKKFKAACLEVQKRCKAAGIELEEKKDLDGDIYFSVGLPSGREKRWVTLFSLEQITNFLKIPFERYVFLGDFIAFCSYEDSIIEAEISLHGRGLTRISHETLSRRLFKEKFVESEEYTSLMELDHPNEQNIRLSIGKISQDLSFFGGWGSSRSASLKIMGVVVSQHDHALGLLEKLSNSLFFQIDMAINLPLGLRRSRRMIRKTKRMRESLEFKFPHHEYSEAPISLYWYARSASEMPLLQFLAYYQCLEFYLPIYSEVKGIRKVRRILKDPIFRLDRDQDIGKILSAIKTGGYLGYGDEKSQLRAVIQECIDTDELRQFLTYFKDREEFYSSKTKGLAVHKIQIQNKSADLRNDVADRIYDIRCKIVHTKSGSKEGEIELLLPFSKEAELLYHDIELIKFLAQKVLIASSSRLQL